MVQVKACLRQVSHLLQQVVSVEDRCRHRADFRHCLKFSGAFLDARFQLNLGSLQCVSLLLKLLSHLVKTARQLADFAAVGDASTSIQFASAQLFRRVEQRVGAA